MCVCGGVDFVDVFFTHGMVLVIWKVGVILGKGYGI